MVQFYNNNNSVVVHRQSHHHHHVTTKNPFSHIQTKAVQDLLCAVLLSPLFRVRVIKQTSPENSHKSEDESLGGVVSTFESLTKNQGPMELWKGCFLTAIKDLPAMVANEWLREPLRDQLGFRTVSRTIDPVRYYVNVMTETSILGSVGALISAPFNVLYTRMAVDTKGGNLAKYRSAIDCATQVVSNEGVGGLFVGWDAAVLQGIMYRSAFLCAYKYCRIAMLGETEQPLWKVWLFYQLVSTFSSVVSYPLDTINKRMIVRADKSNGKSSYKNTVDALVQISNKEGFLSLYKGFWINRLINIASAAISLGTLMIMEE